MEPEDVSSDLHALINLYGLLQNSGDSLLRESSLNGANNQFWSGGNQGAYNQFWSGAMQGAYNQFWSGDMQGAYNQFWSDFIPGKFFLPVIATDDEITELREMLDDKAKLLLKNLLDRDTERFFRTHSKPLSIHRQTNRCSHTSTQGTSSRPSSSVPVTVEIMAAQSSISNKPCCIPPNQPEATAKLQPPSSQDILKLSPIVIKKSSRDSNYHTNVSPKDEKSHKKPMPEGKVPDQSKASIPSTKPESRKKRCRVCQQSSVKQPNLVRGTNTYNENTQSTNSYDNDQDQKQAHVQLATRLVKGLVPKKDLVVSVENLERSGQKRISGIKCNSTAVKSLASSSSTQLTGAVQPSSEHCLAGEIDKNLEVVDYLSEEVAEAIQRIKSRLQALRPLAEAVDSLKVENAEDKGSFGKVNSVSIADKVHTPVEAKEEMVTRSELSQAGGKSFAVGNVLPSQQINQRLKFKDSSPANKVLSKSQKLVSVASDLQSQTASQDLLRKTSDQLSQLGSQKDGNRGTTTLPGYALNLMLKPTGEGLDFPNQDHAKNVKAIVEKIESLGRLKKENDHLPSQARNYVCGLRVAPSQAELGQGSNLPSKMPSRLNKENAGDDPAQNKTTGALSMSTLSLLPRLLDPIDSLGPDRKTQVVRPRYKMNKTQAIGLNQKNNMPHQVIMRPTLLDCNASKIMVQPTPYDDRMEDRKTSGTHKNIYVEPQSRIFPRQQISEETSLSSGSSSSWTSQQTSTSCSESESESEGYLTPRRRRSSPASRRLGSVASYSCSVESSSLSYGRGSNYRNVGSSRRDHLKKEFRLEGRMKPKRQIGRLRRLKNKLGLVFHHHHHHHHHNNDDDGDRAEAAHAMSLWTQMRKIFHDSNKKKVYDDHSVKNSRKKAVVSNVSSKNQQGHFHSLVEGLMRHVRHPKKSKPSKGGIGRLGNGQHDHNKKVVKKFHWWQVLKRKRGVKLSNKGRIKLGNPSKKPQLRAAKMR